MKLKCTSNCIRHGIEVNALQARDVEAQGYLGSPLYQGQSQSSVTTDGQSVSPSWCRAPSGAHDQMLRTV
jgi:hypothetical protein